MAGRTWNQGRPTSSLSTKRRAAQHAKRIICGNAVRDVLNPGLGAGGERLLTHPETASQQRGKNVISVYTFTLQCSDSAQPVRSPHSPICRYGNYLNALLPVFNNFIDQCILGRRKLIRMKVVIVKGSVFGEI